MKIIPLIIIAFLSICSCVSVLELSGNKYKYKSKNRVLELYFKDDSICTLENTFKCSDIDSIFKNIVIECNYTRVGNTVFLERIGVGNKGELYIDIPPQESSKCDFLNKEKRERSLLSPAYATSYDRYGLVPNINRDTLFIIKNQSCPK